MPSAVAGPDVEPSRLVVRRLERSELQVLAEFLPQALGGDVAPWGEDLC